MINLNNYFAVSVRDDPKGGQKVCPAMVATAQKLYDKIVIPVGIGAFAGVVEFALGCSIATSFSLLGFSSLGVKAGLTMQVANSAWIPWIENGVVPIVEELIFRGGLQGGIKWAAYKINPNLSSEVGFGSFSISRAALISIVATALLFGVAHDLYMLNLVRIVVCSVSGLIFGMVRERMGLLGSTSAHVVTNLLLR